MSKNNDGEWQCPVLCKPFTNHSKVCAVRHGGEANVFSYEAVRELNIKAKNWEDLMDARPFKKKDIIMLQDVDDEELMKARDIDNFKGESVRRSDSGPDTATDTNRDTGGWGKTPA